MSKFAGNAIVLSASDQGAAGVVYRIGKTALATWTERHGASSVGDVF
jgi:hypothetical protein